jgi:hypothetical protein
MDLKDLLIGGELEAVGTDAMPTIEALNGIGIHDKSLENDLADLAKGDATSGIPPGTANPFHTIMAWLEKVDPEMAADIEQAVNQPEQAAPQPAPQAQAPVAQPQAPVAEEEQDEDEVHNDREDRKTPNMQELAQWLGGHYNANWKEEGFKSPWRKGVTELGIMAEKEFGPEYGHLVKELMSMKEGESKLNRVARRSHERKKESSESVFNRHNEPKMASALRKGQNVGMSEDDHFDAILRLAGLAK